VGPYRECGWEVLTRFVGEGENVLRRGDEVATKIVEDVGGFNNDSASLSPMDLFNGVANCYIVELAVLFLSLLGGGVAGIHSNKDILCGVVGTLWQHIERTLYFSESSRI
jgi:hypothetical protein